MSAISYRRSRLKKVYPFVGYDTTKSEVKPTDTKPFVIGDIVESQDYQFSASDTKSISFGSTFTDVMKIATGSVPGVYTIDTSGSQAQLGNTFISSVDEASVTVKQSSDNSNSFGAIAIVII